MTFFLGCLKGAAPVLEGIFGSIFHIATMALVR